MKKEVNAHCSIKSQLRGGDLVVGSWLSLGDEGVAEIVATTGFSFVTIDLEHTGTDIRTTEKLIRVIELSGSCPLVRTSENSAVEAKRVMDCGSHGVIVPMVNTKEEAEQAVGSIYYPPKGIRGVGLYRAQNYGLGFEEYSRWLEENGIVIIQIESERAMNNLAEILAVDGIDGALIGPYDLSNSLGVPGELNHPRVIEAERELVNRCEKNGVTAGIHIVHPSQESFQKRVDEGFRLIAYGVDMIFLGNAIREAFNFTTC